MTSHLWVLILDKCLVSVFIQPYHLKDQDLHHLDNDYGNLIKTILIPLFLKMNKEFQGSAYTIPLPDGNALHFWNVEECDRTFGSIQFK
jgi:hypothetical protein